MKRKANISFFRRAATMLLVMMLTTATAWAQTQSFPTASGGTGTEGDPYRIATTADLDALAADVNSGTAYSGTYFKMTVDIAYAHSTAWDDAASTENNYTPIGNRLNSYTDNPFSGTFDGDGHTVSGIRIYKGGSGWGNYFLGLFGYVLNGTVKNVTVADARITGQMGCGGIAGYVNASEGTCTVENCHALSDVAIHAVVDYANCHGGIAGASNNATISGCTSAVTLTANTGLTGCSAFGGIVGGLTSSTMRNCLAIGVSIPAIPVNEYGEGSGAIFGGESNSCTFDHNSYANCNVGGATTNIGGPSGDIETYENPDTHEIKNPDGAIPYDTSAGYILTVDIGVNADGTKLYADAPYYRYASGTTVTLSYTGSLPEGYSFGGYTVNGTAISGNTFTMPAAHVTVGYTLSYTLGDRTIYCDGDWNTLCLPFSVSDLTGTPLEGFTVKELDTETAYDGHATGLDGTTLYLNFKDAAAIEAGRPYIVKKLALDDESTPTYSATAGTAAWNNNDSRFRYPYLIDGNVSNRWWVEFSGSAFCEFHSDQPVYVTGYTLTTGNQKTEQDPTQWTLSVSADGNAPWTVIATEDGSNPLPSARTETSGVYTVQNPGTYQYFRFDVTANGGSGYMCLSELTLNGKHLATGGDVENPTFTDVTPSDSEPLSVASTDGTVSFVGTYSPVGLTVDDQSNLFLGAENTLYWPNGANNADGKYYVGACRAYFHVSEPTLARAFVLNFGDDLGSETGIIAIPADTTDAPASKPLGWYTLDGRRLAAKPTQPGIYINNGRKVVIK